MIILNSVSDILGMPALILFIFLGMIFTNPLFLNITFQNYNLSETICSVCLIFIMFYGGFGTRWEEARWVKKEAILLSTAGVVLTALLVTVFSHYILKINLPESFLIGSVISSTDAASVFSIIRSRKLSLRYRTSSLLELESGSNDPFAFMLTITALSVINGRISAQGIIRDVLMQITIAVLFGYVISKAAYYILDRFRFTNGFDTVLIFAVALISYSLPSVFGGNGYLGVYITGIILGNSRIRNKINLVHFFDGLTNLAQMLLFFLLGFLSEFSSILKSLPLALAIFLFITFIGRPLAVEALLSPFGSGRNTKLLVSFAGLRGAASIVFAILAHNRSHGLSSDIFHITFGIVILSIILQGSFLPMIAKKLKMTDRSDPLKSFTDYSRERPIEFITFNVNKGHNWDGKKVMELDFPDDLLLVLIVRENEKIIPGGQTEIKGEDRLIFIARSLSEESNLKLKESIIDESDELSGRKLSEISKEDYLILLIKRGENFIIPKGNDCIMEGDEIIYISESVLQESERLKKAKISRNK